MKARLFQAPRAAMIEYIKPTHDDLRAHSVGTRDPIDCWQWMLEISTHAERHIQQIRESKPILTFPKVVWQCNAVDSQRRGLLWRLETL